MTLQTNRLPDDCRSALASNALTITVIFSLLLRSRQRLALA
jgi:hypothetical protein